MKNELFHYNLATWYESNHRILPWRETQNPYYIWISEIILQQTRVEQGLEYYLRFIDRFPTIEALAAAHEDDVLRLWQGLGYYSRARNLHKAAQQIMQNAECTMHNAQCTMHNVEFPRTYEELRKLPGVGDYTAGAIASFAYNMPYPALDGNVYRVLARLTNSNIAFDTSQGKKYFHQIAENLLDRHNPRLFNSAIMEFGALYCVPQHPDCSHCPLQVYCEAFKHHTVDLLPVRKPRPKVRDRYFLYTIYLNKEHTLIHQRQDNDIWKHLWEFPLQETNKAEFQQTTAPAMMEFTHQLSHQRLHARFLVMHTQNLPTIKDCKEVSWSDLDDFAFSRLSLRAIEQIDDVR